MNDAKENSGFKSYIGESELESISLDDIQRTKILEGETIVHEEPKVLLYVPLSDRKTCINGILAVTTFKLSFMSAEEQESNCYQQNLLLGLNDVCLSSIDVIYQLGDRTKKKLLPGQNVTGKVKEILIICKNMRSFEFSFKHSSKESGKKIVNALLHHAYPKRHSLLFAYDYNDPYVNNALNREARFFDKKADWEKELKRTKCQNWRISQVNFNYQISPLLIETLIIPQSVTDKIIEDTVGKFRNRFCPLWICRSLSQISQFESMFPSKIWRSRADKLQRRHLRVGILIVIYSVIQVWGTSKGAALVRMADLLPTISDRTEENILLEHIRKSHPAIKEPHIIDLSSPTPKDIQTSYLKLRDLCTPDSTRVFKNQDFKFYGLLDSTKWLLYVSTCLTKALEAADYLNTHESTVVLQEGNGQDLNCVVSSLTQLILDPYFRTKFGFQSLIQKEWVALGHPFSNRLGHILCKEIEPSPIFLLFLDCVWQLLQQFPQAFQISETYLTTLWDSAHVSIFDTFLFNSPHDRFMAETGSLILRSVWDWREQFADKDIILFCNPLYDDSFREPIKPNTGLSSMEIWLQCYFRWLPDLEIRTGGRPQIDLFSRYLVAEILQTQQNPTDINGKLNKSKEQYFELIQKVNSFFPFSHNSSLLSGDATNSVLLTGDVLDTQSILNFTND